MSTPSFFNDRVNGGVARTHEELPDATVSGLQALVERLIEGDSAVADEGPLYGADYGPPVVHHPASRRLPQRMTRLPVTPHGPSVRTTRDIRHDERMEPPRVSTTAAAMCLAHITDAHLSHRLRPFAEEGRCSLCPPDGLVLGGPVVNVTHVAKLVDEAAGNSYNHGGQVFDNEQVLTALTTGEVVSNLLDGCVAGDVSDDLSDRIATLIHEELDWFEPYDMDHEASVEFEWDDFEQSVKHESRLLSPPQNGRAETAPEKNWAFVRSLLVFTERHAGLTQHLQPGTKLYRARTERGGVHVFGNALAAAHG